jgi:polyisoprenoid-binding protein YceI
MAQPSSSNPRNLRVISIREKHRDCCGRESTMNQPTFKIVSISLCLVLMATLCFAQTKSKSSAPQSKTQTYRIDAAQSEIIVLLTQEGLVRKRYPTHRVIVGKFSGTVRVPKDESKTVVEVETDAASLTNVDKTMSDFERREFQKVLHNSVLESARFPKIMVRSVSATDLKSSGSNRTFTLNADLTLHGVTKRVTIPVSVTFNGEQLRATGEAKLRQSEFGITPYSGGLGTIKIGDEVKVTWSITAKVTG